MNAQRKRQVLAILTTCLFGWAFSYVATNVYRDYAFGLFVWLPTVMGTSSTLIQGYRNPIEKKHYRNTAYLSMFIFCLGLLTFAWEGIICMVMAAPIGILFTWIGYRLGNFILKSSLNPNIPTAIIVLILSVPAMMSFENILSQEDETRSIITSIVIKASPEVVWKNVVQFPQLNEPEEFIFRVGIAYPISATISGANVGAIRYCNFSTGSFVEPIKVWDEPNLLQFSVEGQPEPMKEISPYKIHPNHLQGYWVSKKGQFKLTRLPDGNTMLEGTTWYVNKIKPAFYWTLWSDYIVHKIHLRVLEHIRTQAENK
ncbi:MAG TPA: hypothetical protein PLR06_06610 [Cyclobacteriaceae bacterium]|nr:hypothetical protein [Cyclobacteriaceae bacterium]